MRHLRKHLLTKLFKSRNKVHPQAWTAGQLSFSGYGEDVILNRLHSHFFRQGRRLDQCPPGFYVDIGCNHPFWLSNSYMFYLQGWSGICVDLNSRLIAEYKTIRPNDIAVTAAICETNGEVTCYQGRNDTLAGLSREYVLNSETRMVTPAKGKPVELISYKTPSLTLASLLESHLTPQTRKIDFLSIDCEGSDFAVLKSNDWKRFRPSLVCIEDNKNENGEPLCRYMEQNGYQQILAATSDHYPNRFFAAAECLQTQPSEAKLCGVLKDLP